LKEKWSDAIIKSIRLQIIKFVFYSNLNYPSKLTVLSYYRYFAKERSHPYIEA